VLARLVDEGYDLIAPIPSCVLMYKQELPLLFPDDADVRKVQAAFFDPFEYLWLRHKGGQALKTEFPHGTGRGRLPGGLPSAGAEHRPEDPGRTATWCSGHGR
jgi:hypothetical protein